MALIPSTDPTTTTQEASSGTEEQTSGTQAAPAAPTEAEHTAEAAADSQAEADRPTPAQDSQADSTTAPQADRQPDSMPDTQAEDQTEGPDQTAEDRGADAPSSGEKPLAKADKAARTGARPASKSEGRTRTRKGKKAQANEPRPVPQLATEDFLAALAPVTTAEEMRQWDADAMALGIPGHVLMENAAQAARSVLCAAVPDLAGKRVALLMGSGNNGGDAAALSRMLLDLGASPVVYHTKPLESARGDAAFFVQIAQTCGVPFEPVEHFAGTCDILVDGLLGTGFQGGLREDLLNLVRLCNSGRQKYTLALDIPSGLDSFTGLACPEAVRADATVTFAAAKPGLILPWAQAYTGPVHVCYIGTPLKASMKTQASFRELDAAALAFLPDCQKTAYKNSYGHVLVVGGAHGLSGAAHISAWAALRAGAGLVTAAAPSASIGEVKGGAAEIMVRPLGSASERNWRKKDVADLADLMARVQALLVGPGMGRDEDSATFLQALLKKDRSCPLVLDADALMILGENRELAKFLRPEDIVTPHLGEARALLGNRSSIDPVSQRHAVLASLCEMLGCTVLLKGPGTMIKAPDTPTLLFGADVPQLSCGGSGDCLGGVIAALVAQGVPSLQAAALGCVWHGEAGRALQDEYPARGNLAHEIADRLPCVVRKR